MPVFYTKTQTRAHIAPNTQEKFVLLPPGSVREIVDEISIWLVFKQGTILYFVQKADVEYKPIPEIPADIRELLVALLAWARGLGFKG